MGHDIPPFVRNELKHERLEGSRPLWPGIAFLALWALAMAWAG